MRKIFLITTLTLLLPTFLFAVDFSGVENLAQRRIPFLKGKVEFKEIPGNPQEETFILSCNGKKLKIEASSLSAASSALNYYLKNYCRMSFSHCEDNFQNLKSLPKVGEAVRVSTPFQYRYALNYCTYNYTFSFYRWEDWERELDWMALNGINLMLAQIGTEAIWQKTLESVGYTDTEIRAFIPGPSFNAWWLMGNLEGWGGPVSDRMIEQWKSIQQKILVRMKELGIEPVMQGFWGMVPRSLKEKFPEAKIIDQGNWAGNFDRPAVLLPEDPLFDRMANVYYQYMKEYYGTDIRFLGGDLFHEGGNSKGIDVTQTATLIQQNMQKYYPQSTWVLQGWGNNPRKALLDGLDRESTLIIDLFGESRKNWQTSSEYSGFPWIWASVNNFGGKVGMGVQLPTLIQEPHRAYEYSKEKHLRGIGIIPEGIDSNPVAYDWALQTAWTDTMPDPDAYLRNYILYRYGKWDETLYDSWKILLNSVYGDYKLKGEGTFESIYCARPNLKISCVSSWGPREMQYNPAPLERALPLFRQVADQYKDSKTYRYDLVDLARQVLANRGRILYRGIVVSFEAKNKEALAIFSKEFIRTIKLQDELTGTQPEFMVGTWLESAKKYAPSAEDVSLCEFNARALISYWGPDTNPRTDLHDYAHREWNGLLADLYLPRWEAFLADLKSQLDGNAPARIDYFGMETRWARQTNSYPTQPTNNYLELVDRVLAEIEQ